MNGDRDRGVTRLGRTGQPRATAGLDLLSESDCWERLRTQRLGRIAMASADRIEIFPVNFAVGDRAIVFRTGPGTKLSAADGTLCAFEVDFYDEQLAIGWSVVARGGLFSLSTAGAARVRRAGVDPHPVAPGERSFWVVIDVDEITGRSFNGGMMVPYWSWAAERRTVSEGLASMRGARHA